MPFTPVTYNTGAAPGLDGPAFNTMQLQFAAAINAFEQDVLTPFVFSGLLATRDGTTLSQLDVTAGIAFPRQNGSQNELYRRAPTATTFSASGHPSTTLYLDLNPDGSWSWGTAHSATANYLPIASVVTDSSSNIASVTDARTLATTLLSGMAGALTLPALAVTGASSLDNGAIHSDGTGSLWISNNLNLGTGRSGAFAHIFWDSGIGSIDHFSPQSGAATGHLFVTWTGSAQQSAFSIGGQFGSAPAYIGNAGDIHDAGGRVAVQGAHSAGQPALSYGAGAPTALAANEIYFQMS